MSEIEYRALCIKVSHGIDWQTEGETLLSLCKGRLIAEGSENLIGNAADLLEQLEGQNKLGIDHLEVLKELLGAIEKWALVDKIDIFEINRKNYLSMLEKVILKLDELNCLEQLIRICTPYLEEGRVGGIESIRVLFEKLESNYRFGPANLGILREILKKTGEDELLREVEEFEKKRKDENSRDRKRKEAEKRRQARVAAVYAVPGVVGRMMGAVNVHCNLKTVGGVVVAVGACVVLYKYSRGDNDIQQFANVFNEAILPAANSLRAIGNGSLCFTVQAEDRAALQLLWEQYQDNTLQTKLQDFLVTEEIKQLADGEDVSVTVYIDEQEYQDACLDFMMEMQVFSDKEYGHHRDTNRRNSDSVIYMEPKENEAAAVLSKLKTAEIKFQQEKIETLENQIIRISKVYSEEEERDLEIQQLGHITDLPDDATADVYRNEGNKAFKKGDFINAIHFYTEGIKMNCSEKELKAKLYNNRAIAHFKLGNHQDSLRDAGAATELNPTFLVAIVRGAIACVELKRFEEAITWCDKGLAIDENNRILSSLRFQSVREVEDKFMEEKDPISHDHGSASSGDVKKVIDFYNRGEEAIEYHNLYLKIAKEVGEKHGEGNAYGNLGNGYHSRGDFRKAIEYHNLHLKIAKEVGDNHGKGVAYGNLGVAYHSLGDFKKAIEYHKLHLDIAKKVGDKHGEGKAYGNVGNVNRSQGDFKKAIEYHNLHLKIAQEVGDKHGEGNAYGSLGKAYHGLGDFKKAIEYHNLNLKIAEDVRDKHGEGGAYGNLGNAYISLGDFKKAVECYNLHLKITKEVEDKHGEGSPYGSLGNAYDGLGDFKTAIEYHNLHLKIVKEVGNKHWEGETYGNLGNAYHSLGDFKKAVEYNNLHLKIAKEVGDRLGEGNAFGNLGNAYHSLGDFKKAIEYHNLHLRIAKEVGDRLGEGGAYGNLGNAYQSLGDFKKAIEYYNLHLKIAKEVVDKRGEGVAYGNLGNAYRGLGDFKKAIGYQNLHLKIAKEVEDKSLEAMAYCSLGCVFELQGELLKAVEHYQASINLFNSLRVLLISKDEWKVDFRNRHRMAYTGLWRVLVEQGNIDEALFVAEEGRAQVLTELMESSFCGGTSRHKTVDEDLDVTAKSSSIWMKRFSKILKNVPSNTVFQAVDKADINLWVVSEGKQVQLRQSKLNGSVSEKSGASQSFKSFMRGVYTQLGVRFNVRCENRSLDALRESWSEVGETTKEDNPQPHVQQDECLSTLYDIVMKPVADLLQGDELLIIPDGPLWLAPYAALKDGNSKYLYESFRIRLAPSSASLRLIADCPDDYHQNSGALLVGDPWVAEVINSKGEILLEQLPCAKEEVEMIGKILNITPITGRQATKFEVLKRLSSVSLVHFAAHGCIETGEIALTPDPHRISAVPTEEDYILTITDVLNVRLRAKLVVLSCFRSVRGEIKAEDVVGIARAFMGAGARSVVVSLWAIDGEATLEFMKCFYQHLAEGKPASESLNLAMKSLRESDKFHDIKYWAPFSLIGDDVNL